MPASRIGHDRFSQGASLNLTKDGYECAGDRLTVCYQLGEGPRPAAFESPSGTQILLVRYRRGPRNCFSDLQAYLQTCGSHET